MTPIELVFYLFSTVLILSALAVITVRNAVYAALFLVLTFFSAAAIWMLLETEFLAITLVLVYVGAVMVLFLFVVMMLDMNSDRASCFFALFAGRYSGRLDHGRRTDVRVLDQGRGKAAVTAGSDRCRCQHRHAWRALVHGLFVSF